MDALLEQEIVALFVNKGYQERISHELGNAKKRSRVLHRLCHNYADVIKPHIMTPLIASSPQRIMEILAEHGAAKHNCYVLSLLDGYDGVFAPLDAALARVVGNGMAALVYCHNDIAYFETEQVQGPPPRFLLKASKNVG